MDIVYKVIFVILLFGLFLGLSMKKEFKNSKKRDKLDDETDAYLETVLYRINSSTSPEALLLLLKEIKVNEEKYVYDRRTYDKFYKFSDYKWYALGKITGLTKKVLK